MRWPVVWSDEAQGGLLHLHFEIAPAIKEAVDRWVDTGGGTAVLLGGDQVRVVGPGASAILAMNMTTCSFLVLRIEADAPLPEVTPLLDVPGNDDGDD